MTLVLVVLSVLVAQPASGAHESGDDAQITLDPESGPAGEYVWIRGEDFEREDRVEFGGIEIAHDHYDDELLGFTVPDIAAAEYEVSVIREGRNTSVCCFELIEGTGSDGGSEPSDPEPSDPEPSDDGATTSSTSGSCREPGMNIECNEFGSIKMPSRVDITGDPVVIKAEIWLNTNYKDQEARHLLFSIRNISIFEESPIILELQQFGTDAGEIVTTRVDHQDRNELNLWVDVLDTPVQTLITLEVKVGATDRGAFDLETIVIPFDRGYEPIRGSGGKDVNLFTFTLLGVKDETGSSFGGGLRGAIPGLGTALAVGTVAIAAVVFGRRVAR